MKYNLLIAVIFFTVFSGQAQERALAKVHYLFKHINDTTQRDKFIIDEVVTYLSPQISYYTSYSSVRMLENTMKQISSPDFDGNLVMLRTTSGIKESYLLEPVKSQLIEVKKLVSDEFLLETPYPIQDWEIQDEAKVIGGYNCQKATAAFGGRHYTAWFTTEIPFSFGPWKLHGLPGLILTARDDKGEVEFAYDGFDKLDDDLQITIGTSANTVLSKPEEVEKLEKAFKANSNAYMNTKSGGTSTRKKAEVFVSNAEEPFASVDPSKIKSMSIMNDESYKPSSAMNNPLELEP